MTVARDSALLIVDMQRGLLDGSSGVHDADGLLERIHALIARATALRVPVIYVVDDDVGEVGSPTWEVHPKIAPRQTDLRLRKTACDAFHETSLRDELEARAIRHLVIAGCKTEACIDTTCRRAVTLGYAVTLVADGHSTTDVEPMPAPQIIAYHNKILNEFGAYVAGAPREIIVAPGSEVQFDRERDVPSSVQEGR